MGERVHLSANGGPVVLCYKPGTSAKRCLRAGTDWYLTVRPGRTQYFTVELQGKVVARLVYRNVA